MRLIGFILLLGLAASAQRLDSIWITNSADNTLFQIQRGSGAILSSIKTPLGRPVGCCVKANGECWVAIQSLAQVIAVDANGKVIGTYKTGSTGRPTGMGVDLSGNVWCGDLSPAFVMFSPKGVPTLVNIAGARSSQNVACDSLGNVWAGDGGAGKVYKIGPNLKVLVTLTKAGHRTAVIDHSDNVYTTGFSSSVISKWANDGTALGSLTHGINTQQGLAVDADGNLWLANQGTAILKFDPVTRKFMSYTSGGTSVLAVAVDGTNRLWICNYGSGSVTIMKTDGTIVKTMPVGRSPIPIGDNSGFQRAVFADPFGDVDRDLHLNNAEATAGANPFDPFSVPCAFTVGGTQARGGTATLTYADAGNRPGAPYAMACSFRLGPIPIGKKRQIFIAPDDLFSLSVTLPTLFRNFLGVLDKNSQAVGTILIPNLSALKDVTIYCAAVTFDPLARDGVRTITPPTAFKIK